jgi:hypothetical protein
MAADKATEKTDVIKDEAQVKAIAKKAKSKKKAAEDKSYEPFVEPE